MDPTKPHISKIWSPISRNLYHSDTETQQWQFSDYIFKCIFLEGNVGIVKQIALNFVHCSFDNKPSLVRVMAWRRAGDKPLSESTMAESTGACMPRWASMYGMSLPYTHVAWGIFFDSVSLISHRKWNYTRKSCFQHFAKENIFGRCLPDSAKWLWHKLQRFTCLWAVISVYKMLFRSG